MISEEYKLTLRLEKIFMPNVNNNRCKYYNNQNRARFVHYTSSETALNIIKTKCIWMRNTTCMSDYREVEHGFKLLNSFFLDDSNKNRFSEALNSCSQGIAEEAFTLFDEWWNEIRYGTYIASVSEHNCSEDQYGRLSMWRALGGNSARVAFVFSVPWQTEASKDMSIMFNPVSYHEENEVHTEIDAVISKVQNECEFLKTVDHTKLLMQIFSMLRVGVTCLKHQGFREEREWRILYSPKLWPSSFIRHTTETIDGIPQVVQKLPLDGIVSNVPADLSFANIFDRLIIGPSQYPLIQYEAFVDALREGGVMDAKERVVISGIPIRT